MKKRGIIVVGLMAFIALVIAACGGGSTPTTSECWVLERGVLVPTPCPPRTTVPDTITPVPPTAMPTIQEQGQKLFVSKGCSACHGQDGQGTAIAPALPGHSAAIVKRQVRAPVGIMPLFSPDEISNEELEQIVSPILETPKNLLQLHAFGEMGDAASAARAYEKLPSNPGPVLVDLQEELKRRYVTRESPHNSDEWLVSKERDYLLLAA